MPVPFKVKAVFDYNSPEPDDLVFGNGQIITVIEDDDADWYTGQYVDDSGQKQEGIFPRNFVEKYEPAIPSRPTRPARKTTQPEVAEVEPPQAIPPAAITSTAMKDISKEAEIEPRKDITKPNLPAEEPQPPPPTRSEPQAPAATFKSDTKPTSNKLPPPVAEKPSSFKDRIAAFNKGAAAPVTPFKPSGGSTGFIKKPFVAPPPSRNAYVPPPRDLAPQKVFRRDEDSATSKDEDLERPVPEPPADVEPAVDDDQPKPTSLKDRIALLQKQQLEQAARNAEVKKREKPKRPTKSRTESSDMIEESTDTPLARVETNETLGKQSIESKRPEEDETKSLNTPEVRQAEEVTNLQAPLRELVSDTNDADDSGAGDTEDALDVSTEEERHQPRIVKPISVASEKVINRQPTQESETKETEEEDGDTVDDEDEDPDVRRRRELRDRMAKMSGGMGMMGMFGGGMSTSNPRKPKPTRDDVQSHEDIEHEHETSRAPPVPIMALPGMANIQSPTRPEPDSESDQDKTAGPTPQEPSDVEEHDHTDDYISQPSRKSTERSAPTSPQARAIPPSQTRAAPPPLPNLRPEPPQSPGSRPVPPPPPPTRSAVDVPFSGGENYDVEPTSLPIRALPPVSDVPVITRGAPPPPPSIQTQPATSMPESNAEKRMSRAPPPIPTSLSSPQNRAPPPPLPGQPPSRRSTNDSLSKHQAQDDSEDEVTEYDGDYDTDIGSSAKHRDALKSHNRYSNADEGVLTDDAMPPPTSPPTRSLPPLPSMPAPQNVPPPLPQSTSKSRKSAEAPRAAPPPVPQAPTIIKDEEEDEYDPYRYNAPQRNLPSPPIRPPPPSSMVPPTTEEPSIDDMYDAPAPPPRMPPPLMERPAPPPPPSAERSAPPPPPQDYSSSIPSMSGAIGILEQPPRSLDIQRNPTVSRRSMDVNRSNERAFIASDIDLVQPSLWWTQENNPPPTIRSRPDVLYEIESSTSTKRGGRATTTRDVYVLYQDYSQTTINATFDTADPTHISLEQSHEPPPPPPRKDQLESASETYGIQIAKAASSTVGNTVGEGNSQELVTSLIRSLTGALMPVGTRAYGALVYANLANASTQQFDEIRAGDIITFRNAKFAGHKGGLHQKYSVDVGKPEHVGVVIDWDGTKKKIRAWEQGRDEKGKRQKVREESYKIGDMKSGEVRIWRVMPRAYVNWGTS